MIAPRNSIDYYTSVKNALGGPEQVGDALGLCMEPGMSDCSVGEGADHFDEMHALEQWVEAKKAPDQIVGSHLTNGVVDRTRLLCAYPQVAVWLGNCAGVRPRAA